MILSYLTVAWRNMSRRKLYSLIAIFGLAVGMSTCSLVADLIRYELSYDRFHEKADRIFRVILRVSKGESERNLATIRLETMRALNSRYPEFQSSVGLFRLFAFSEEVVVISAGDRFLEERSRFKAVDGDFFDVFSFSLLKGNPETALKRKGRVVITEATAAKYFGRLEPLGQEIHLPYENVRAVVSGVVEDFPPNSHLDFDFLFSREQEGLRASFFELARAHMYVVLPSGGRNGGTGAVRPVCEPAVGWHALGYPDLLSLYGGARCRVGLGANERRRARERSASGPGASVRASART